MGWGENIDNSTPELNALREQRKEIDRLYAVRPRQGKGGGMNDLINTLNKGGYTMRLAALEIIAAEKEIAELVEALEPFAVEDKESLIDTLGHINREHIAKARAALAKTRGGACL